MDGIKTLLGELLFKGKHAFLPLVSISRDGLTGIAKNVLKGITLTNSC